MTYPRLTSADVLNSSGWRDRRWRDLEGRRRDLSSGKDGDSGPTSAAGTGGGRQQQRAHLRRGDGGRQDGSGTSSDGSGAVQSRHGRTHRRLVRGSRRSPVGQSVRERHPVRQTVCDGEASTALQLRQHDYHLAVGTRGERGLASPGGASSVRTGTGDTDRMDVLFPLLH